MIWYSQPALIFDRDGKYSVFLNIWQLAAGYFERITTIAVCARFLTSNTNGTDVSPSPSTRSCGSRRRTNLFYTHSRQYSNVGNNIGILGSPVCLAIVDLLDHLFRIGDVPFKFWLLFVKLGRIRILHKLRVYLCECVLIMRLLLFELLALLYLLKQLWLLAQADTDFLFLLLFDCVFVGEGSLNFL